MTREARYTLEIRAGLVRALAIVAACFLAIHLGLFLWHYRVSELHWLLLQLFDLDSENNLPTWFSAALLMLAAAVTWLRACVEGEPRVTHWTVLAVGFAVLSVDEVAGMHETFNTAVDFTWAIPGGLLVLAVGVYFVPFLLALPRATARRFVLAGALYVAGAVGMEFIGNYLALAGEEDTLRYDLAAFVEEGLELYGVLLFLKALLDSMRAGESALEVEVVLPRKPS